MAVVKEYSNRIADVRVRVRKLTEPEHSPVFVWVYVHRFIPQWLAAEIADGYCEKALYETFSGSLTGQWVQVERKSRRLSTTRRTVVSYRFERTDHNDIRTRIEELRHA